MHQLWPDISGKANAMLDDPDERAEHASRRCPNCPHSMVVHRRNGCCYSGDCSCGWERGTNGELIEKSTGLCAVDTRSLHKKRKGRVSKGARPSLMRIPCYFCGDPNPTTIDHLVPLSRLGSNRRSNLVSACALCNSMKSGMLYDEFIAFCRELLWKYADKTAPKKVERLAQAKKIIAWHEARLKAKQSNVPVG